MFKKIKKTLVAVAAAAMALGAMAIGADAYSGYKDGTYTTTANLYVPKAQTPVDVKLFNAYFSSPKGTIPPSSGASESATLVVDDEGLHVTIPVENDGLSMLAIGTLPSGVELEKYVISDDTCSTHGDFKRYTSMTFLLTPSSSKSSITATISDCSSHAKIDASLLGLTIASTDKNFTSDVILTVDIPSGAISQ